MQQNRRRDSKAELSLRRTLHGMGLRYRVDLPVVLGDRTVRPDVVFTRARLAIFVDGCFWHSCPLHGNEPKANTAYWGPKLRRNVERDKEVDAALAAAGWQVIRAWEHEDPDAVAAGVAAFLRSMGLA